MSNAMLWPYGKCVECANKSDCVDSQAQIIACISNGYPDYKPQTNADKIRAMTDEELAKQLAGEQYVGIKTFILGFDRELLPAIEEETRKAWPEIVKEKLDWLKEEASDVN